MALIQFTDKGLYCAEGNFYIDPWQPVDKAVITHAHSDHARWGSKSYLCHTFTKPLLQQRLGDSNYETLDWGQPVFINGVKVSLHPAGHIIGSSQIRIENNGDVWVVSGDYKTENDGISGEFEPMKCNTFITESTFGLPIYNWKKQADIFIDIQNWIKDCFEKNTNAVIIAYSLGKAQRIIAPIAEVTSNIHAHGAVWNIFQTLKNAGFNFPDIKRIEIDAPKEKYKNAVIIAPPSAEASLWMRRFTPFEVGVCSGWMQVRGNVRRRNIDAGFALSDHADWNGLLQAIEATGASKVFVTHGFQSAFSRYLNEKGIESAEVKTEYGNDEEAGEELKIES